MVVIAFQLHVQHPEKGHGIGCTLIQQNASSSVHHWKLLAGVRGWSGVETEELEKKRNKNNVRPC